MTIGQYGISSAIPDFKIEDDEIGSGVHGGISRETCRRLVELFDDLKHRWGEQEILQKQFMKNLREATAWLRVGKERDIQVPEGLLLADGSYDYYKILSRSKRRKTFKLLIENGKVKFKRIS